MAEAAPRSVWGTAISGREKQALDVLNEAMPWWAGLQQEGKIERFDVTGLVPSGGDVAGFMSCAVPRSKLTHYAVARSISNNSPVYSSSLLTSELPTLTLTSDSPGTGHGVTAGLLAPPGHLRHTVVLKRYAMGEK